MTERELINSAKIFQANCGANGNRVSFADSCKVVLLSHIEIRLGSSGLLPIEHKQTELLFKSVFDLMKTYQRPWWKFWKRKSRN